MIKKFGNRLFYKEAIQKNKKYSEFLELIKKSVKLNDMKPGFICYNDFQKFTIISEPYISSGSGGLIVDCITTYSEGEFDEFSVESDFISLSDYNIVNGGYNLNRLFYNKKDAIQYSNIAETYKYWAKSRYCFDGDELKYKIKPISGEKLDLKNQDIQ